MTIGLVHARESCETNFLCTLFIRHFLKAKGVKKIQVISSLRLQVPYSGLLIFRGKKQNFAGFSGANSRKNRPISRDFRGKKSIFAEKSDDFAEFSREKSQISQKNRPISRDFSGKSQISNDFQGQIFRKIG